MMQRYLVYVITAFAAALAVVSRVVANTYRTYHFTPIGAMGIFGGARLRSWQAFAIPISLMVATDCVLCILHNFNPDYLPWHASQPWVYASFAIYVAIGRWFVGSSNRPERIVAASLLGTTQFFLITNFEAWLRLSQTNYYTRDLEGLLTCYAAGLKFLNASILSDLIFTPMLFYVHAWLSQTSSETLPSETAVCTEPLHSHRTAG